MSRNKNEEQRKRDTKGGKRKRDTKGLVDQTLNFVVLTLWGENAEKFEEENGCVVAVKGVSISHYSGTFCPRPIPIVFLLNAVPWNLLQVFPST